MDVLFPLASHTEVMASRAFFLYTRSNDLAASRRFYRDLVGLEQIWDEPDSIAFVIDDWVQLSVDRDPDAAVVDGWSFQRGWVHGLEIDPAPPYNQASWSIALTPDTFRAAVERLQQTGAEALRPEPFWVGYWSYVVRDPMGQTVELSDPVSGGPE